MIDFGLITGTHARHLKILRQLRADAKVMEWRLRNQLASLNAAGPKP